MTTLTASPALARISPTEFYLERAQRHATDARTALKREFNRYHRDAAKRVAILSTTFVPSRTPRSDRTETIHECQIGVLHEGAFVTATVFTAYVGGLPSTKQTYATFHVDVVEHRLFRRSRTVRHHLTPTQVRAALSL